jgi:hypothetical protein
MDPFSAAVITSVVMWLWVKNVAQDAAFAVRGEEPPSARRERERYERRQAERAAKGLDAEPRRAARNFFGNAWADAWASAEERRARAAEKTRQEKHARWAERDVADAVEDEAWDANRARDREQAKQQPMICEQCERGFAASDLALVAVEGKPVWVCPPCADKARAAYSKKPPPGAAIPDHDKPPVVHDSDIYDVRRSRPGEPCAEADGGAGGTVIPFAPRPDPPATDPAPGATYAPNGEPMSSEAVSLQAAIKYTNDATVASQNAANTAEQDAAHSKAYAAAAQQNVKNVEQAIAGLLGGDTSGPALTALAAAQEQVAAAAFAAQEAAAAHARVQEAMRVAAANFHTAHNTLLRQLQVKEAYDANKGAGTRAYVTKD